MKKVLIIVDLQQKFKTKNNQFVYENLDKIEFEKYFQIYATKFKNKNQNQNFEKLLNFKIESDKIEIGDIHYTEIEKGTYSLPIDFVQHLKDQKVEQVDIVGTDYDSCVLAIGFQIFDSGIVPKFYRNLIGTHSIKSIDFKTIQKLYKRNFGKDCFIN